MRRHRRIAVAGLAMVAAGLVGGVAVAAQTGTLPVAGGRDDGPNPTAVSAAERASATSTPAAPPPDDLLITANGQGPDATGAAKYGLCKAFASGQGTTNGGKADSVAFQALATAAGGAGNIAAYCADATPRGNALHGQGTPPSTGGTADERANEHATSATHGPPADPGSNGQGHRP